jgi:hypothetical protein
MKLGAVARPSLVSLGLIVAAIGRSLRTNICRKYVQYVHYLNLPVIAKWNWRQKCKEPQSEQLRLRVRLLCSTSAFLINKMVLEKNYTFLVSIYN